MGGVVGRLFREYRGDPVLAVLCVACVSLTMTPMIARGLLQAAGREAAGRVPGERASVQWDAREYEASLSWGLRPRPLMMLILGRDHSANYCL